MTSRALAAALTLALLMALGAEAAWAVGNRIGPKRPAPTLQKYVQDLTGSSASKRSYAARVLRRQVKAARRQAAHGPEDDLTRAEAMQRLTDFDQLVAPACTRHLSLPEITIACADILKYLESRAALPALKAHLLVETRRRAKKRLTAAIAQIESTSK